MSTKAIHIDAEIKQLIPPLSTEERTALEASIQQEGCRDRLVVALNTPGLPDHTLLDGHNRYEICKQLGVEFATLQLAFDNREAACRWIIGNQLARRNLEAYQRVELALMDEDFKERQAKAKSRQKIHGNTAPGKKKNTFGNVAKSEPLDTTAELAKKAGIGKRTASKAKKVAEQAPEAVKEELRQGQISINQAYKELTKRARLAQRQQKAQQKASALPSGQFDVILADPPWQYEHTRTDSRRIENQYPTLTVNEIIGVSPPAADNAVLFLWAPAPKLEDALQVLSDWGFTYRTHLIWDKVVWGMGYWFRSHHELLLVGVKGRFSPPQVEHRIGSILTAKRLQHSQKPKEVYEWIEAAFPGRKMLECFARNTRPNWEGWGNEL